MKTPRSVNVVHTLILVNATFWLLFALFAGLGLLPPPLSTGAARWVLTGLAICTSAALAGLVVLLRSRKRLAFYMALAFLAVIAILSVTDEVGLPDLFTLAISLAAIIMLIINRAWYLSRDRAA